MSAAEEDLMQNNAIGENMLLDVRSLHVIILMPNMAYAAKHAKCPEILLSVRFIFLYCLGWAPQLFVMGAKLLQKSEMRKDIVIELSYKGFG